MSVLLFRKDIISADPYPSSINDCSSYEVSNLIYDELYIPTNTMLHVYSKENLCINEMNWFFLDSHRTQKTIKLNSYYQLNIDNGREQYLILPTTEPNKYYLLVVR